MHSFINISNLHNFLAKMQIGCLPIGCTASWTFLTYTISWPKCRLGACQLDAQFHKHLLFGSKGWVAFFLKKFPVDRLKVSPCIWSPLPVLTLPCLCTAFCTWFLLSVSKWVQWGAHGTLPFNILTLFQQEGEQTWKPFPPKIEICWLPLVS